MTGRPAPDDAPALRLRGVVRSFESADRGGGSLQVLGGVDLDVATGSFTAILGPSGGGKTTLLRIAAGLETLDAGRVFLRGWEASGPSVFTPPEDRRLGFVFQDYALFPHLTALGNAAFGVPGPGGLSRAWAALQRVGLSEAANRLPSELSGGEQQRVALARALAPEPQLVLLDEPFSNLDAALRADLREDVAELLRALGITAVLVTHDREEAFSLADRVHLLLGGRVARSASPEELARDPGSREAARFLGETNFLPAESDGGVATCEIGTVRLARPAPSGPVDVLLPRDGALVRAVEPVHPVEEDGTGEGGVPGAGDRPDGSGAHLVRSTFHGAFRVLDVRLASGTRLSVRCPTRDDAAGALRPGDPLSVRPAFPIPAFPREP